MKIINTLATDTNEEFSEETKYAEFKSFYSKIEKRYQPNNEDRDEVNISTSEGAVPAGFLTLAEKNALALTQVRVCSSAAASVTALTCGSNFDRVFEGRVMEDQILYAIVKSKAGSEY